MTIYTEQVMGDNIKAEDIIQIGQKSDWPSLSLVGRRAAKMTEWTQLCAGESWFDELVLGSVGGPHAATMIEILDRHLEDKTPLAFREELEAALQRG